MPTEEAMGTKGKRPTANDIFQDDRLFGWSRLCQAFHAREQGGNNSGKESEFSNSPVLSVKPNNASTKKFDVCPQPALSGGVAKRRVGSVFSQPRYSPTPARFLRSSPAKRIFAAKSSNVVKRSSYSNEATKSRHGVGLSSSKSLEKSADDVPTDDSFRRTIFDTPIKPSLNNSTVDVAPQKRHSPILDDFETEGPKHSPTPAGFLHSSPAKRIYPAKSSNVVKRLSYSNEATKSRHGVGLSSSKSLEKSADDFPTDDSFRRTIYDTPIKPSLNNSTTNAAPQKRHSLILDDFEMESSKKCLTSRVVQSPASNTSRIYGNSPSVLSNSVKRFRHDHLSSAHQEDDKENDVLIQNNSNIVGFKNFGNTCYINSAMQALLGLDILVCELLSLRSQHIVEWSKLFTAVCNLMELKTSPACRKSQVDTTLQELCHEVSACCPQFSAGHMHDSMEFLTVLIDKMKGEIAEKMGKDIPSNPFCDNFDLNILTVTKCPNCSALQTETTEKYFLQVAVADPKHNAESTQDLVNYALQPKEVNSFKCLVCEHQVDKICQASVQISKLPSMWVENKPQKSQKSLQIQSSISLKNFTSSAATVPSPHRSSNSLAKIHSRIEYSPSNCINRKVISQDGSGELPQQNNETALCLSQMIPETQVLESSEKATKHIINKSILPRETSFDYQLISIVSHLGSNTTSGHYISDVYNMSKKCWSHCDDCKITSLTEAEVLSNCASNGCSFFYAFR